MFEEEKNIILVFINEWGILFEIDQLIFLFICVLYMKLANIKSFQDKRYTYKNLKMIPVMFPLKTHIFQ